MKAVVFGVRLAPSTYYVTERLLSAGVDIECVVLDGRDNSAKDLRIWEERTEGKLPWAPLEQLGVPIVRVDSLVSDGCAALLRDRSIDLVCSAASNGIYKSNVLSAPKIGILNVHPGWLPKYRGSCCVEWAILNDDEIGVTSHFMTEGLDEGPILIRKIVDFPDGASYSDIRIAVYKTSYDLMARTAQKIRDQRLTFKNAEPQGPGSLYKPMTDAQMAGVIAKVREGRYRPKRPPVTYL